MARFRRPLLVALLSSLVVTAAGPLLADGYGRAVVSKVVLKTTRTAAGLPITYPTGPAEVSASVVTIAPGGQTGWHRHPVPVYAWVVAGTLQVEYEGAPSVTVRAGEPLVEAVGTAHNGRNAGPEPVELLVFTTGVEGRPSVTVVPPPYAPRQEP